MLEIASSLTRRRGWLVVPALTFSVCIALTWPVASLAMSAPQIGPLSIEEGNNTATLKTVIKPEGLGTAYEFWLAGPQEHSFCPCTAFKDVGAGYIDAGTAEEALAVEATGLEPDRYYT